MGMLINTRRDILLVGDEDHNHSLYTRVIFFILLWFPVLRPRLLTAGIDVSKLKNMWNINDKWEV
jgi:hypothetical protein